MDIAMKKVLFVIPILFYSSLIRANTCEKTQGYQYYKIVKEMTDMNKVIEANEWAIAENKKIGDYEEAKRVQGDNNLAKLLNQHTFQQYRTMGGQAKSIEDLERVKNPCGDDYSDSATLTEIFVQEIQKLNNMKSDKPNNPKPNLEFMKDMGFIKPHQQEKWNGNLKRTRN